MKTTTLIQIVCTPISVPCMVLGALARLAWNSLVCGYEFTDFTLKYLQEIEKPVSK